MADALLRGHTLLRGFTRFVPITSPPPLVIRGPPLTISRAVCTQLEGNNTERVEKLQAELTEVEARAAEAQEEVGALEVCCPASIS